MRAQKQCSSAQGREKEVVIFSAVRSAARRRARIGFVADERRINVGLTRARTSLLLVGNLSVLKGDAHWAALIRHAIAEGCVLNVQLLHVRPCSDDWLRLQKGCGRLCSIVEHYGATQPGCPHGRDESCNTRASSGWQPTSSCTSSASGEGHHAAQVPVQAAAAVQKLSGPRD